MATREPYPFQEDRMVAGVTQQIFTDINRLATARPASAIEARMSAIVADRQR